MNNKYLFFSETLRKYPSIPYLSRTLTKPVTLNIGQNNEPVTLKERVEIIIPIYSLQRDPKYFPDPENFDPNRFTAENNAKRPPCVYLPFGEGPRKCIGEYFISIQSNYLFKKN